MSFSTYVTTWDNNPLRQVQDMISKSALKPNTRIILAFASFNFLSTDYVPGISNMSIDDLIKFTDFVHSNNCKVSLSIGGATYPFYGSDLYSRPGDLANNINILLNKCKFDGVDFDIEDSSNVPSDFTENAASVINTLRSLNSELDITLTTPAQAWNTDNYQKNLINLTFGNINAWQPMEYDLWIEPSSSYNNQIKFDIDYYLNVWNVDPRKIILGLMPGQDDLSHDLSLDEAKDVTQYARLKNLKGIMIWSSNIDGRGCDGNAPYAYTLGIQNTLNSFWIYLYNRFCCYRKHRIVNINKKKSDITPPPPPTPPTSPDLTDDEINKIRSNFDKLYDLNFAIYVQQGQIIDEVFNKLHGAHQTPDDPKSKSWVNILETVLGLIVVATEGNPGIEVASILLIGVVNYLTEDSEKFKDDTDLYLDTDCADMFARNTKTYNAQQIYLGYMFNDPNSYRDQEFSYLDTKITLRDFINMEIPDKASTEFGRTVQINGRSFRQQLTIPEMKKMDYWDIYKVQDDHGPDEPYIPGDAFGLVYTTEALHIWNNWEKFQRNRDFNSPNVGVGCRIHANDEVWAKNPAYVHAEGFGNNNDDLVSSYLHSISQFVAEWPATIIYPWSITNKKKYDFRWYIFEGNGKVSVYSFHYGVANGEFMKWLFIDDGVGNVINPEGVIYRRDALKSEIFSYGKYIIDENIIDDDEEVIVSSNEWRYSYPGCNQNVTSNRVYTGDF